MNKSNQSSSLRGLKKFLSESPSMVDSAYAHLGGLPRPVHLVEILDQMWPECHKSEFSGKVIMAPKDAERLEALFELFGVPMLVSENSIEVLGRGYDVFCQGLGSFVSQKLMFPTNFGQCQSFRAYLDDWSDNWVEYIEAVAAENKAEARRLASTLQLLAPECEYPPDTYIKETLAASAKIDAERRSSSE
jgi:hypothetical protein